MPHLSPMNWMAAPLMFLMLTTPMMLTSLWWSQTPSFPLIIKSLKLYSSATWNWN